MPSARLLDVGALLRREASPRPMLPYARHVTDEILALDSGALMVCLRLDGASFETADIRDLNDWHGKLNGAWRNLASDRLAVWHHLVRRPEQVWPQGRFRSVFAGDLDAAYRARIDAGRLHVNDLFLTLVLRRRQDAAERAQAWLRRLNATSIETEDADVRLLEDAGRDLQQHLARYVVSRLRLYERAGLAFSEPLEMLRLLIGGRPEPAPLTAGHLGEALYASRLIFGREAL